VIGVSDGAAVGRGVSVGFVTGAAVGVGVAVDEPLKTILLVLSL